jgi:hypothetical protein
MGTVRRLSNLFGQAATYPALLCPFCGDEWTHVDTVTVATASGRSVTVTASGEDSLSTFRVEPGAEKSSGRRHDVRLLVNCEMGCPPTWIVLQQHKGRTFVELTF